jgi:MFS family permease
VLGLEVGAYLITYMDRVNISSAMPVVQQKLGLTMIEVGWIFSLFRRGYALFQIPGGWLGDRIGPRRALSYVFCWWSVFTSLTSFGWSAASIGVCRFLFGVGVRFPLRRDPSLAGRRLRNGASPKAFRTQPRVSVRR